MIAINNNNLSVEELMRLAKASGSKSPEEMLSAVQSRVSADKMNEIKKMLGDKKALEELLKSEQAQRLMRQFKK
ncbi:MAG: hypothetical protein IJO03_05865 [Clostridia bacterium]|nr:hypothetical protein [Clostridia bacterium]MBQ7121775.1 hypothetical protein [Clostridia bacterium]